MKRLANEPLSGHTTFKIGGPATELVVPQEEGELIQEIERCQKEKIEYRLLGKGSNILVHEKGIKGVVLKNTEACYYVKKENGLVKVGSSLPLQELVNFCVNNDLEGMEYLYSIPGTVGGAIYMNAGTGRQRTYHSISDNLVSVLFFDGKEIHSIPKNKCEFQYRRSIFQKKKNWVILGATFLLKNQPKQIGRKKISDRMSFVMKNQDRKYPNAGSIFKNVSRFSLIIINGLRIGDAKIEKNWIVNLGNARYHNVLFLINLATLLSYFFLKKAELEIEIWK